MSRSLDTGDVPLDLAGLLVEAGAASTEEMERALARQRELGGALDTALLELGIVSGDELGPYLSRVSGLPLPPAEALEPDPRARRMFPARVAERHGLAPFGLEGKALSLLATHPVDMAALDEISFMLSLHLVPHVAPEWQVRRLQVRVYGGALPERFAALARAEGVQVEVPMEGNGEAPATLVPAGPIVPAEPVAPAEAPPPSQLPQRAGAGGGARAAEEIDDLDIWIEEDVPFEEGEPPSAPPPTPPPTAASQTRDQLEEPLAAAFAQAVEAAEDVVQALSPAPPPEPPGVPPHWTREAALAALDAARSRDEVVSAALRYLRDFFAATALFAVTRDLVSGHDAMGWPHARERCRRVRLAPGEAGLFGAVLATKGPYLGPVAQEPRNADLLETLGRPWPRLALLYPVSLRDRPVCIFYADNGDVPVSPRRLGDLLLVLGSLSGALERVLRDAKRIRALPGSFEAPADRDDEPVPPGETVPAPPPVDEIDADSQWKLRETGRVTFVAARHLPVPRAPAPPGEQPACAAAADESLEVPSPFDPAVAVRRLCRAPPGSVERGRLLAHIVQHGPGSAAALREAFPGPIEVAGADAAEETPFEEHGPVLLALHALGSVATPFLVDLLSDPSPERRRQAALLLGRGADPAGFLPLAERTLDPHQEAAEAAVAALAAVRRHPDFQPVLEQLRRVLLGGEADRGAQAAHALGALGDVEAIPLLIQALEAPGSVAGAAAGALAALTARRFGRDAASWLRWWKGHRRGPRSDWLFEALVDPDRQVRVAAAEALRVAAPPPLIYRVDAPPREREDAARAWRAWWDEQRLEA